MASALAQAGHATRKAPAAPTAQPGPAQSNSPTGNFGVPLFLQSGFGAPALQTKLAVNAPGDLFEREDDHVADLAKGTPRNLPGDAISVGNATPKVQRKCEACTSIAKEEDQHPPVQRKCAACEEEEVKRRALGTSPVQTKCPACEKEGLQQMGVAGAARDGVVNANLPLPHLDRIQASFGRHDITNARASVGGVAAESNRKMGSLAYTSGDRIAFRNQPDVILAAHEATHVVQQRNGAKLPGGVGQPGDIYEQQADAAAQGVGRGESVEAILDAGIQPERGKQYPGHARVQFQLAVNAIRLFEPEAAEESAPEGQASGAPNGQGGPGGAAAPDSGAGGPRPTANDQTGDSGGPPGSPGRADAQAVGPPGTGGNPPAGGAGPGPQPDSARAPGPAHPPTPTPALPGAGGGPATSPSANAGSGRAQGASPAATAPAAPRSCAGGGVPACYDEPSEQPAQEPEAPPPNQQPNQVQGHPSHAGEEEVPEPDNCPPPPPQAAAVAPDGAAGPAPTGPGPGASSGSQGQPGVAPSATDTPTTPSAPTQGGGPEAGAAPDAGGMSSAASPMDAAVAGGEGARSEAVGRYQAAASELAESRARIQRLRTGVHFVSPRGESHDEAANRETASSSANDFFNSTADQLETSVAFVTGEVPHSLGTQAEAAKGAIAASIDTEKAAITRSMEAARRRARTDAAIARRAVTGQAAAMVRAISTGAAAALRILSLARTTAAGRIDTLETTGLGQINNIYSEGRATLAALGPTVGDECIAVGSRFASQYRGFANCRENSFWDGDLSGRRAAAQANAANETAQSYKDGIVQSARDRAREITRNGRKDDRCAVLASAAESRHTLQTQYDGLTQAIETARSAAVRQAESARDGLLASINRQLADAIRRLNAQEHDQRQAADDTGYIQQVMQEQLAHSGVAALQQSVISAVTAATQALESLRSRFGENHPPDNEALNVALTQARSNVGAATRGLQSRLEQGNSQSSSQMTQAGSDGLAAVTGVATSAAEAAGQSADGFHSTMNGIGETDNFAEQRTGFQNTMQQAGTGGGTALAQVATGMEQSNTRIAQAARASLSRAGRELETSLRNQKHGLECEITTKATEAASKEAPAWKRVLAVVLVIIVIIIVIAVIILTAGMALGPLATIAVGVLIGAAVGAVTSGLLAVAGNLWGNRSWSRGVGDAMIQGAIVGAIGGGLGAGVGLIFKSATITVQMVSQMVAAGLVDTVTQLYNSHWSFENFSFLQLGFTLVVTALSFGFANKVAAGRVGFANRIRAMAGLKNLAPPPPPVSANATMVGNTNTPAFRNLPADRLPANLPAGHSWSRNAAGDWIIVRAPGAPAANLEVHVYADASGNINLTMSENGRLVFSDAMTRPTGNTYSANKRYPLELRPAGDRNPYYENLPGGGNRMWNKAHGIDYADTLEGPGVMDSNLDPMNYTPGDPVVNQQIKNQQVADARRNGGGYREFAEYGSTPRSVRGSHRTPARQIPDSYLFIETNRSGVPIRAWRTANVIGGTPTPVPLNQVPRAVLTATPAPPPPPGTPLIPYVVYGHPGDDEGRQPSGTQSAQPASDAR